MNVVHNSVVKAFRSIGMCPDAYPLWFAEGKTTLIPKPGVFTSENHRITCFNTIVPTATDGSTPVELWPNGGATKGMPSLAAVVL